MFNIVVRVAGLVTAFSFAGAQDVSACSATPPQDDWLELVSLGAIGVGVLVTGIALTLRPPKRPQPPAADDGSTTTLPAS